MVFLSIYLAIGIFGIIYSFVSRGKLVYINAPEDILPPEEKWKILRTHIITSVIMGVILINLIVRSLQPKIYLQLEENGYLAFSIIGAIIVSFMIISGLIQLHLIRNNVHFANTSFLLENPDLLIPEEHYQTTNVVEESQFWDTISLISFDDKKREFDFSKFEHQVSKYHPSWIVEFYHTLINKKIDLIKSGVLKPYSYIFRKYQDDFHSEFCEFIIMNGSDKFQSICENLNSLSTIEIDILKIKKYNLSGVLGDVFFYKTRKPLIPFRQFEDLSLWYEEKTPKEFVMIELPQVFQKFK